MNWTEWCQLCAKEKPQPLKVVNPKSSYKMLNMIENYLQISLPFQDACPAKICFTCVQMLVSIEKFLIKLNKANSMFRELSDTDCKLENKRKIKLKYGLIEEENEYKHVSLSTDSEVKIETNDINIQDNIQEIKPEFIDIENPIYDSFTHINQNSNLDDEILNQLVTDDLSKLCQQSLEEEKIVLKNVSSKETDNLIKNKTEVSESFQINDKDESMHAQGNCFIEKTRRRKIITIKPKGSREPKPIATKGAEPKATSESKPIIKQKKITCEFCQKVLRGEFSYFKHLKKEHNIVRTEELPPCQYCGKILLSKTSLKYHEETHLPVKIKRYTCEICGFEAQNKKVLRQHKRNKHTTERSFVCEICGKSFRFNESLNDHTNTVHKIEPVKCHKCNKEFRNPLRLRKHQNSNKDCQMSKKRILEARRKRIHKKIHECILCGKTSDIPIPRRHLISHLDLRPYHCRFCEKKCKDGNNVRAHEMSMHLKDFEAEKNKETGNKIIRIIDELPPTDVLIEMLQKLKNDGWSGPTSSSIKKPKRKVIQNQNIPLIIQNENQNLEYSFSFLPNL